MSDVAGVTASGPGGRWSDHAVEQLIGRLLQAGVLLSAIIAAVGGVMLLAQRGGMPADYSVFRGEPDTLRSIGGIVRGSLALRGDAIAQLGLVVLIATPIARVAFTLVAFILQRDRTYALVTTLVLALLLYGLLFGVI